MNWYKKIILSGSVEEYLQSLGATPDIIQFITSQGSNSQILVNEFRKNPNITIKQLQQIQIPTSHQQVDPYTDWEKQIAHRYLREPFKKWVLVNLRKIRILRDTSPKNQKSIIHNFYMTFIDSLPEIFDWAERSTPTPDISSYAAEQAMEASDEWHNKMSSQGEGVEYEPTQPNLVMYGPNWKNPEWQGWTIQKVISANDLKVEGNKMDHCVGGYCEDVERGNSTIFSLRDPQNNPHITIETNGEKNYNTGTIKQIQGKSNSEPKGIYKAMIKEWISLSGEQEGINKEINAFENFEEMHLYEGYSVTDITEVLEKCIHCIGI